MIEKVLDNIEPFYKNADSINIVFSFDYKFAKCFLVALKSIVSNASKDDKYDIVCFASNVPQYIISSAKLILTDNFAIRFFDIREFVKNKFSAVKLKPYKDWSVEMYYRIFIPVLMRKYKKVLYLDTDTLCVDNLNHLFEIEFQNKKIVAVKDTIAESRHYDKHPEDYEYVKNVLKLKNPKNYFNSGMILFNIGKIEPDKYIRDFVFIHNSISLRFPDQDILNALFKDDVLLISPKWNLCCGEMVYNQTFFDEIKGQYKEEFVNSNISPSIIHYTSSFKPWSSDMTVHCNEFWDIARNTPGYEDLLIDKCLKKIESNQVKMAKFSYLYNKILNTKKLVFWGASLFLEEFFDKFSLNSKNLLGVIDKNVLRQGEYIFNYQIFPPEELNMLNPNEIVVTIINRSDERQKDIENYIKTFYKKDVKLTFM